MTHLYHIDAAIQIWLPCGLPNTGNNKVCIKNQIVNTRYILYITIYNSSSILFTIEILTRNHFMTSENYEVNNHYCKQITTFFLKFCQIIWAYVPDQDSTSIQSNNCISVIFSGLSTVLHSLCLCGYIIKMLWLR